MAPGRHLHKRKSNNILIVNDLLINYSKILEAFWCRKSSFKNTISSVYLPRFCSRERGTSTHCLGPPHSQLRPGGILSYLPIGLCLHHLPASLLSSFVWTFRPQGQFTVQCVYTRLFASLTCDPKNIQSSLKAIGWEKNFIQTVTLSKLKKGQILPAQIFILLQYFSTFECDYNVQTHDPERLACQNPKSSSRQ